MRNILLYILLIVPLVVLAERGTKKTQSVIVPTQSPQAMLSKNKNRKGLIVSNNGTDAILLQFGSSSTSTTEGMTIAVNTAVDFKTVPLDAVYVQLRASTGTNNVGYIEFE